MKLKFTDEARQWWKLWSNQLALLVAAAMAWAVENQHIVLQWVETIDQPWRSILTFVTVAGIPILLRSLSQAPKAPPPTA